MHQLCELDQRFKPSDAGRELERQRGRATFHVSLQLRPDQPQQQHRRPMREEFYDDDMPNEYR
jgi:hypothetical protein